MGIEQALRGSGTDVLHLAGYGSLLNPDSARRTIRDTPQQGHPPIVVYGARRTFNYVMPVATLERYRVPVTSVHRAALNSVWTGKARDRMNARLVTVSLDDLDALREREIAYDLVPVVWVPWAEPDAEPSIGFTLRATERSIRGTVWVDDEIMPCLPYLEVCRVGARRVSDEFEDMFIETTTLADGRPLRALLDGHIQTPG